MSRNKVVIDSLISEVQAKDVNLYDLLNKMSSDLNDVYQALFTGPLPVNDGSALTNLTAGNITGVIPLANLPANIAFKDSDNLFSTDQSVIGQKAFKASVAGTSYARLAQVVGGNNYVSGNIFYNGAAWVTDGAFQGSLVQLASGQIGFFNTIAGVLSALGKFDPNGCFSLGFPFVTGAGIGDMVMFQGKNIFSSNAAGNALLSMLSLDISDVVRLGLNAANTGKGHVGIPKATNANLPAAAAAVDGIINIDTTNNRLCYYVNGARYYLAGTLF